MNFISFIIIENLLYESEGRKTNVIRSTYKDQKKGYVKSFNVTIIYVHSIVKRMIYCHYDCDIRIGSSFHLS